MKKLSSILFSIITIAAFNACAAVQESQPKQPELPPPPPPAITQTAAKLGILTHASESGQQTTLQMQKQTMRDMSISLFSGETPRSFEDQPLQAIAANIPSNQVGNQLVQLSESKGIPLLFYGTRPSSTVMDASPQNRFIGARREEWGLCMGEIALKLWDEHPKLDTNNDKTLQYVLLDSGDGIPQEAVNIIEQAGVGTAVLGEAEKIEDSVTAAAFVSRLLEKGEPPIEMIFCSGEAAATGAVMALQSAGYNNKEFEEEKFIPIVACGETAALRKMTDSGVLSGIAIPDSQAEAAAILQIAANLANGSDPMEGLSLEYDPLTKTIPIPCQPYLGPIQETVG